MAERPTSRGVYEKVHPTATIEESSPQLQPQSSSSRDDLGAKKSWRAPVLMLGTLLLGLVFSLAHHFMNVRLDGRQVAEVSVSQTWISRISTGLAFTVKLCFTVCVGVAFVQRQWWRLQSHSFTVKDVDAMTAVLGNALSFIESTIWMRHPVLALTAAISWLIPFAAIVTPGSLSVEPVRNTNVTSLQVPQPGFQSSSYAVQGTGGEFDRFAITNNIYKLAFTTASSAKPAPLPFALQNASYTLTFNGPTVKCGFANDSMTHNLTVEFGVSSVPNGGGTVPFMSWVAGDESNIYHNRDVSTPYKTLDDTSKDAARIFVLSNEGRGPSINYTGPVSQGNVSINDVFERPHTFVRPNITECILYNASYNVGFNFRYPQQEVKLNEVALLNPVSAASIENVVGQRGDYLREFLAFSAMMDAYGKILVGRTYMSHYGTFSLGLSNYNLLSIDWTHAEATQAGLEQFFHNFTLSLLSDSSMIKNETAEFVPVTSESWPIVYVYNSRDLFIAYGLSFLFSLICTIIGFHAYFINNASYQNTLSSFMRAMNGSSDFASLSRPNDAGADPLPKDIAKLQFVVSGRNKPI